MRFGYAVIAAPLLLLTGCSLFSPAGDEDHEARETRPVEAQAEEPLEEEPSTEGSARLDTPPAPAEEPDVPEEEDEEEVDLVAELATALKEEDLSFCEAHTLSGCYLIFAAEFGLGSGACDHFEEDQLGLDSCFWRAAHADEDSSICEQISREKMQQDCAFSVANPGTHGRIEVPQYDESATYTYQRDHEQQHFSAKVGRIVDGAETTLFDVNELASLPDRGYMGDPIVDDAQRYLIYPEGFIEREQTPEIMGETMRVYTCHGCRASRTDVVIQRVEINLRTGAVEMFPGSGPPQNAPGSAPYYLSGEATGEHVLDATRLVHTETRETLYRYGVTWAHIDAIPFQDRMVEALQDLEILTEEERDQLRNYFESSERGTLDLYIAGFRDDNPEELEVVASYLVDRDTRERRDIIFVTDLEMKQFRLLSDCRVDRDGEEIECHSH